MILAILFSIIGLGVIAATLHRMTINALPVFAGMTAGFAAHHGGIGLHEAAMIAFASGAMVFGLLDALSQPNVHPAIRLSARVIYTVPACILAWAVTLSVARIAQVSEFSATLMAIVAVASIGGAAWKSFAVNE
jgi:hypothetical protein